MGRQRTQSGRLGASAQSLHLVGLRNGDRLILGTWVRGVKEERNLLDTEVEWIPYIVSINSYHNI
jgi:hypothetical protein